MTPGSCRYRSAAQSDGPGAVGCAIAGTAAAQPAGQDPIALGRFEPAPAGDRFFGVPSPFAAGDPDLHLMLLGDYAHNPLVLSQGDEETPIVEHQLIAHLNATLALWNRLHVNIDVPVALLQSGDSPTVVGGSTFTSPSGAEFGDLRAGLRLRLVGGVAEINSVRHADVFLWCAIVHGTIAENHQLRVKIVRLTASCTASAEDSGSPLPRLS